MTDISALEGYAGALSEAASQAAAASQKQHDYVHGDVNTDVATESGPVPSLAKQAQLAADKTELFIAASYRVFATKALMDADLGAKPAQFAQVTDDPDAALNGWYSKQGLEGAGSWKWIKDQPVPADSAERLFKSLDTRPLPAVAWSVGDEHGAYPIRLREDGVTELDSLRTEQIALQGAEALKSLGISGVVMALLDALGNCPWLVKDTGVSCFSDVETGSLKVGGLDIMDRIKQANIAKKTDMVMGGAGLVPLYADMTRISGWGSSSLDYLGGQIASMLAEIAPGATYFNGAKAGETARGIAGRLGSIPMLISVPGGELAASGATTVTCSNVANNAMMRPFTGLLSGAHGTLSSDGSVFTFTRTSDGNAVTVPANTPFLPDVGPTYRSGVGLLWMGKNDIASSDTAADIAARTDISFDYFTAYVKRILVFGHFGNVDWLGGATMVPKMLEINALHAARYGSSYIDVLSYVGSPQVWADTGITPNSQDLLAQAGHCLPPSLTDDGIHFNAKLNAAFIAFLKTKLFTLGWF
ncbi:hypothetical protein [Pseudomonas putida]|uniref:hypothetical protein n=1 Tax=Pseudomonas putida TaxID=303 RepID=UPI0034667777